jgi:cbb3-type cytochrome oxidase subunit 3
MDFIIKNSPIIGLLFFFFIFCFIAITLILPKNKKKFKKYGQIPFKDE